MRRACLCEFTDEVSASRGKRSVIGAPGLSCLHLALSTPLPTHSIQLEVDSISLWPMTTHCETRSCRISTVTLELGSRRPSRELRSKSAICCRSVGRKLHAPPLARCSPPLLVLDRTISTSLPTLDTLLKVVQTMKWESRWLSTLSDRHPPMLAAVSQTLSGFCFFEARFSRTCFVLQARFRTGATGGRTSRLISLDRSRLNDSLADRPHRLVSRQACTARIISWSLHQ